MALIFTCLRLRIKSGSPAVYKSASSGSRKKMKSIVCYPVCSHLLSFALYLLSTSAEQGHYFPPLQLYSTKEPQLHTGTQGQLPYK